MQQLNSQMHNRVREYVRKQQEDELEELVQNPLLPKRKKDETDQMIEEFKLETGGDRKFNENRTIRKEIDAYDRQINEEMKR